MVSGCAACCFHIPRDDAIHSCSVTTGRRDVRGKCGAFFFLLKTALQMSKVPRTAREHCSLYPVATRLDYSKRPYMGLNVSSTIRLQLVQNAAAFYLTIGSLITLHTYTCTSLDTCPF